MLAMRTQAQPHPTLNFWIFRTAPHDMCVVWWSDQIWLSAGSCSSGETYSGFNNDSCSYTLLLENISSIKSLIEEYQISSKASFKICVSSKVPAPQCWSSCNKPRKFSHVPFVGTFALILLHGDAVEASMTRQLPRFGAREFMRIHGGFCA